MADNINMQQTEYDEVLPKLMTLHQEELENIRSIMTQIRSVSQKGGSFYVTQISAKVNTVMNYLENQVVSMLEQDFNKSETNLMFLMDDTKGYDSV